MAGLFDDVLSNDAGIAGGLPAPKKRISAGSGLFDDVLSQPDPSSLARRVVGDSAISLLKGAISLPEAAVGIADIPTMGYAGKAAEAIGFRPKEAKAALDELYTPEQQAANARVQEAKGFVPTITAAVQNPSVIGHTVLESLPSMGGGAVVGRGLMAAAPKIGAVGAGAIGEGSVGAGLAAEGIRQQTADGTLTPGQAGAALASGVGTAALGAAGGKVAQKLGIGDIDTMLVGGAAQAGTRSLPARVAGGAISEGLLEEMPQSMQEQAWQNVALDRPVMEGVPEAGALGALAGGVMGAGGGIISGPAKKPAGALSKTVAAGEQSGAVQPIAGALPNYPLETQIVFPDGSTGTRKQFDDYLAGLPEDQRADAMAKMLNLGAQPSRTPEDIAQAKAMAADANQSAKVRSAQLAQEEGGIGDLTKPAPTAAKKPALTAEQREANRLAMEQEKAQGELPQRSKVRTEAIPKAEAAPAQSAQQPTKESQDGQGQATQVLNPVGGAVKEAAPPLVSAGPAVKPADKPDAGGQGNTPKATDRAGPGLGRVLTALEKRYEDAKAAGDQAMMRTLAHAINAQKATQQPKAEKPAAKAKGLTIGAAPGNAEPVTVRKGVIHIGDYPAQNFDSGEDVRVPEGANGRQIREALKAAGAIPRGHKIYGLQADDQAAGQPEQNPPAAKQDAGKAEQNPAKAEPIAPAEPETSAPVSNATPPSAESAGAPEMSSFVGNESAMTAGDWHKAHVERLISKFKYSDKAAELARTDAVDWESHQDFLETALEEGKTIPDNVLADYRENGRAIDAKEWPKLADLLNTKTKPQAAPEPGATAVGSRPAPAATGGFDSAAFDKARDETIKASKKSGAKHLDDIPASVESMRGLVIHYAHDTKQRGVIRTVDNRGNVYVQWSDEYSAGKEMASETVEDNKAWLKSSSGLPILRVVRDGKTYVMQSSLGTSDLKDYVIGEPKAASVDAAAHEAASSPQNDKPAPSAAQSDAGNYAKGHVRIAGMDISIENPEGSMRTNLTREKIQSAMAYAEGGEHSALVSALKAFDGYLADANPKSMTLAIMNINKAAQWPAAKDRTKELAKDTWANRMQSHYGYIRGTVGKDKDHIDVFIKPGTPTDYDGLVFVVDQQKENGHLDEHKVMLGFADIDEAKAGYRANYSKDWRGLKAISTVPLDEFKDWLKTGDTTRWFAPITEAQAPVSADEFAGKWFGTQEKAQAYIDKKGVGATHAATLKDGKWLILPKAADRAPAVVESKGPYGTWRDSAFADRNALLRQAGYSDSDQIRALSGTDWSNLTDPVRNALVKAHAAKTPDSGTINAEGMTHAEAFHALSSDKKLARYGDVTWIEETKAGKVQTFVIKTKEAGSNVVITKGPVGPDRQWGWGRGDAAREAIKSWEFKAPAVETTSDADLGAMFDDIMGEIGAADEVPKAVNRNKLAETRKARGIEVSEQPPVEQQPKVSKAAGELRAIGEEAFSAGEQRVPPDFMAPASKKEWLAGWDAANAAAPVETPKPEATRDTLDRNGRPLKVGDNVTGFGRHSTIGKFGTNAEGRVIAFDTDGKVIGRPSALDFEQIQTRTAGQAAASAAKNTADGFQNAIAGLGKLFGGAGKMSSGLTFDEQTYEQAKPLFAAAARNFAQAGADIRDVMKAVMLAVQEQFGNAVLANMKPYVLRFAKDVQDGKVSYGDGDGNQATAYRKVAEFVSAQLASGLSMRWQDLFAEADKAFGGTQAEGKYSVKDAYDAMEMGVNLWIRDHANYHTDQRSADTAARIARELTDAIGRLPTQTKRTAEQDEFQQFSTPPALSFVANWVAKVSAADTMMEPSAGTGDLAIWSERAGAGLILNELASRRAEILRDLFPKARVFTENAEQINNVLPNDAVPTVVVMNPPFSATAGRVQGKRDTNVGALHVEQALKRLANGGRLVAIVGEGMGADRPAFKEWWKKIQTSYNVRANIGISGKEYAKYGTTFDNQILVIDKNGPTNGNIVTGKVESVAELPALLEGIRNDRPTPAQSQSAQPESTATAQGRGNEPGPSDATGRGATDAVGSGKQPADAAGRGGNKRPASELGQPDSQPRAAQSEGADEAADGDGQRGRVPGRSGRDGAGRSGGDAAGGTGSVDSGAAGTAESGLTVGEAEQQKAAGELTNAVFENYQPQRLKIPGAKGHPGKLVQSAAMSAVEPPAPTYTPNLPAEVIKDGLLSLAQLESIVYAGQAHSQMLPNGDRRGFFIGDGTGVGKGREISGIILDNMRQGRKKAVWISFSEGLINDAQRDFSGIGGNEKLIFWQGKTKPSLPISAKDGILFTSYSTLKSSEKKQANDKGQKQGRTRLDQIVEWLGADFDGVIAFDEAHKMGNVVQVKGKRGIKKPSQQAIAGVNLQRMLPKARVVYVSATGATEVSNLGYASRLGLWGEGTAFSDVKTFIANVAEGGVAAMELISRDMKALGMYIARSLSFDGVTYRRLEHELTPLQTEMYDTLARAWQGVLQRVNEALKITDGAKNGNAKSAAMSAFWSSHQRFFNQVITALQTPTVIEDMQQQVAAGNAVVVQLTNTNEATQEREVAKAQAEGVELEELDFTPRQTLIEYVSNSFPVQAYQESTDADGNTIYVPVTDSAGNQVFDKDAIAMRDKLLEDLQQIRVPGNPLDEIINTFGAENVAEVTGRGRRFVQTRDEDGNLKIVEEKRGKHAAQNDAAAFQGDKRKVLIFSEAGGTGFSFHADNTAQNKRKRFHYILQPGWRADTAVQGFGRTHRTNQASEPEYVLPTTDLKAQKRFVSSIARRLDQLGALTRGQRQATSQGLFSASDNLESKYAEDALEVFFSDLYRGATPLNFNEVITAMGLESIIDKKTGGFNTSNVPEIPQFLNRLLSLESAQQDAVFSEFEKRLDEVVEFAIQNGVYDNGLQTLTAQSITKVRDEVALTDQRTGAQTRFVEVDVTNPVKYRTWAKAKEFEAEWRESFVGWFKAPNGRIFGLGDLGERINAKGEATHRGVVIDIQDGKKRYIDNVEEVKRGYRFAVVSGRSVRKEVATKISDEATAKAEWEKQISEAPKTRTERTPMIVGVVLPIWDRVKGHPRIVRLQTDDGERMIGRMLSPKDAPQTLKNLGIGSTASKMPFGEILTRINSGDRAILANQWEISKSMVSGESRIEIKTPGGYFNPGDMAVLRDQGVFFERIQWRDRAFVPTGNDGEEVFARIVSGKPVVDLIGKAGDDDSDLASRPATAQLPRGHTPATVRAEIAETIGAGRLDALERKGLVRIHTDYRTMPAAAQKHPDAWGWFDGMTVHLVAGNLHTGQAAGVFQHEVWHRMLRGLRMSDSAAYVKIMDRLAKIEQNGAASKWFAEAAQMIPQEDRADYARRLNELAAYAIQQYESEPKTLPVLIRRFVEDLVASVRAFFMDTLGWVPQNLTAADLVALTRRHVRAMADGYPAIGVMGAGEAMASRQDDGIDFDPKPSTIEAAPAPIGSEDEFQSAARLFLSNFPEGTRHSERSATARAARAASEAARWEFGSDAGRTRRVASRLGPFAGYETREHVLNGLNGHKMLVVNVYGEQQIAEGLGFAPALTVTVHEDGEFSIYGPPSHSALYKHMAKRGWAEPTRDAAGNRHETLDGGFWTRLPDVKFREVVGLLGDVHARVLDWRGVEHTGLYWKRTTGATGNIGGHEGAIYFSRPTSEFVQAATDRAADLFQTSKTFGLWHKTVGTQFHKASVDADFGRVFKIGQKFLQDVSQFAMDAADQAPALLPKLGSIRDVFKRGPKKADLEAVSKTIFNGTLDNKLYSDAELAALGLNEKQRALYREFRAATDKSIDDLFVAELTRELRAQFPMLGRRLVGMSAEDAHAVAIDMLQEELAGHQFVAREAAERSKEKAAAERMAADLKAQIKASVEKFNRVQKLKGEGYAPLMRFGQYTVDATTTDAAGAPERVAFFMFETEREANAAARKLRAADPTLTVTQGVMSQEEWRMFQGVSPDSMELFAEALGADQSEVFQKYLKLTLNNRSALKRLIRRTGVEGFSQDATRVLATFITSNSRLAARTLNVMPLKEAVDAIPREKGDVKDEAVRLANYLTDPKEEAQALRGWMFVHFIGGSVASALTNMTQPLTMTAPYLAQWGSAKAGKALAAAAKVIARKSTGDVRLDSALAKAEAEGITAPHEIHQLYAESIRSLGSNAYFRKALTVWGSAFAVAEAFNRRLTFIAAFKMAQENPALGNAFAFAERAVEETQGIYNKGNRPDWARGAVGATVFTFKQFSIAYVEFLKRLPPKQRALALAILFLAAGLQGWPFAEDVQDLIDTIGQSFGYNTNSKRWTHEFAVRTLGEGMGEFVTHGFSAIPGVPLDVSARMGLGNLIPGTAMFKLSETDRSRDVLEFVGPAGSIVKSGMDAFSAVQQGRIGAAAAMAMPVAAQNFTKALDMVQTGEYRDRQGRKVTEVDGYDAAIKAIGFQPAKVAKDSRAVFETKQSIDMARNVESSLADRWARGIIDQKPEDVREARADLADWNAKNPESRIVITPRQIAQRVKEARMSRAQRFVKTAPRELRPMAMESLTGG